MKPLGVKKTGKSRPQPWGTLLTVLRRGALVPLLAGGLFGTLHAQVISVNFRAGANDNNSVDAGESATSLVPVAGAHWNNITVRSTGGGSVNTPFDGTPLVNETGTVAAMLRTTIGVGDGWAEWADVTDGAARGAEGEAGLMQSHLNFGGTVAGETITITGLGPEFTEPGYAVYLYFDFNGQSSTRTYGLTVDDGTVAATFWVADQSAHDADADNDGLMEWVRATGATPAEATPDANYAVHVGLRADSFVIRGARGSTARAILSGFQIVARGVEFPHPPTIDAFTAARTYVAPGATARLSWASNGATTLTLNPGAIDLRPLSTDGGGSLELTVHETATYTLTAANADGATERTLEIAVGPARPNLVLFLVDDLGPQDTSVPFMLDAVGQPVAYRFNAFYRTPNLERLAASGMRFTTAYAQSVCSPTRCGIMTGRNSARHAVTDWVGGHTAGSPTNWRADGIDATDVTLPQLLKRGGYRTIHVGKAHFADASVNVTDLGFDVNIAGSHWGHPWKGYLGKPAYGGMPGMEAYDGSMFLTRALTIEANRAIENAVVEGRPFFLNMCFYAVHAPFTTNPDATGDYRAAVSDKHRKFATMIEGMDRAIGQILQQLVDLGVAENTLIVFLGDNGSDSPALTQDGLPMGRYRDFPMRGKKGSKWEGGIRVPFLATWAAPASSNPFQQVLPIPVNSIETDIVTSWDIPATLLDVAGLPGAEAFGEDSHSLAPYLKDLPGTHRPQEFVIHYPHNHRSDFFSLIRRGDLKLIYNYQNNTHQLYNLATDPTESHNLATEQPETVMRLARALAQKLDTTWGPRGPLVPTIATTAPNGNVVSIPDNPAVDLDADGLPDTIEDPDLDGLVDPGKTDPDNPNSDGDHTPDGAEVRTGTDPLNSASDFTSLFTPKFDGRFLLTWPSKPGATYAIHASDEVADWSAPPLATVPAHPSHRATSYSLPSFTDSRRFYQVELLPLLGAFRRSSVQTGLSW